jgi:hypothetical protein
LRLHPARFAAQRGYIGATPAVQMLPRQPEGRHLRPFDAKLGYGFLWHGDVKNGRLETDFCAGALVSGGLPFDKLKANDAWPRMAKGVRQTGS